MDIREIGLFLEGLPWYFWALVVLVIMFIFGDSKLWDFEVKFAFKEGVGRGKIELESFKKRGTVLELEFEIEEASRYQAIEIFVNDKLIYTLEKGNNNKARIFKQIPIEIEKPKEGDQVQVKINNEAVFSGQLVLD